MWAGYVVRDARCMTTSTSAAARGAVVEVSELRKSYGGRTVVDGVSFTVEEGEIFGILGPNGAGKTTTVECVEGLRVPDAGRIRVAGLDPIADHAAVTKVLGAQLQESELQAKLTVREALELYAALYPNPADWRPLAERLGLTGKLDTRFGVLSGGQKQRLFIALALIGNPRVVVLDELTTGLDPRARRDTWEVVEDIRARGVTVLLVTHFMEEAQRLCDRIALFMCQRPPVKVIPLVICFWATKKTSRQGNVIRTEVAISNGVSVPLTDWKPASASGSVFHWSELM
jgi:ABC-2 type transport system ATP-binding protein